MKKFILMRKDTGTFRSNVLGDDMWAMPAYTRKIDNAAFMSRRTAKMDMIHGEQLMEVDLVVNSLPVAYTR